MNQATIQMAFEHFAMWFQDISARPNPSDINHVTKWEFFQAIAEAEGATRAVDVINAMETCRKSGAYAWTKRDAWWDGPVKFDPCDVSGVHGMEPPLVDADFLVQSEIVVHVKQDAIKCVVEALDEAWPPMVTFRLDEAGKPDQLAMAREAVDRLRDVIQATRNRVRSWLPSESVF